MSFVRNESGVLIDTTSVSDPMVEYPPHYHAGTVYEAIRVIEAWALGFHLGNAVKYICRANLKDNRLQNLQKARWYLDREIRNLESGLVEPEARR